MTQQNSSQHDQERDLAIDRYIQALDRGDLEAIAVILDQAAYDPKLDRLIHEAHDALYVEAGSDLFAADAEQVLTLVQQHLPSAFVDDSENTVEIERPLTVGEVVARLPTNGQVPKSDVDTSRKLHESRIELPDELTTRTIGDLAQSLGIAASERFWRAFRETAIMLGLGNSQAQMRLAAARATKASQFRPGAPSERQARKSDGMSNPRASIRHEAIVEAIAAMYDAVGIVSDFSTPRIVPLDRLIAAHTLGPIEMTSLTRHSAAKELAARSGQNITLPEEADAPLAGFLYAWPYRSAVQGCLLVEQNDMIERRRFSAAHELGHYILHFRPQIQAERAHGRHLTIAESLIYRTQSDDTETVLPDGVLSYTRDIDTRPSGPLDDILQMEEEANQFAAELLMPEAACRALVQHFGGRASARRLATEFLVSEAAMRWRLKNLGLDS